jgi:hypothetical protein
MSRRTTSTLITVLTFLAASTAQQPTPTAPSSNPHHEPITEDLSHGATFKFKIAPDLPEFTFKVLPNVQQPDGEGSPQSTIADVQVFRGESKEPLQSLGDCEWLGMEAPYRGSDWFRAEDMNFDGYLDIFVLTSWGATGNESGCVWLYNPRTGRFQFSKEFSELGGYTLDPATKTIITRGHAGADAIEAAKYVVGNDRPVLTVTVNQDWDSDKQEYHCVVKQRHGSESHLVTVRDFWTRSMGDACDPTDPFGEVGKK